MKKLVLVSSLLLAAGAAFADHHGKADAAPAAASAPAQEAAKPMHTKKSHGKEHGKETSAAAKAKNDAMPAEPAAPGKTK